MVKAISDNQRDAIAALLELGWSHNKIAKALAISGHTVQKVRLDNFIESNQSSHAGGRPPSVRPEIIRALLQAGYSVTEVADICDCSYQVVYRSKPTAMQPKRRHLNRPRPSERTMQIVCEIMEGRRNKDIAHICSVAESRVSNIRVALESAMRDRSGVVWQSTIDDLNRLVEAGDDGLVSVARKLRRLLLIDQQLRSYGLSITEFAEQHGCTAKTVKRDISLLRKLVGPTRFEKGEPYRQYYQ